MSLSRFLIKKYNIKTENVLWHSDISPNRKKDPGEKFPWKYLAKNKISIWHSLSGNLLKKNRQVRINEKATKLFINNLYKIGYSKNLSKNLNKTSHLRFIVKAFQRRFRQELISGKIDKECLIISNNLIKKYY